MYIYCRYLFCPSVRDGEYICHTVLKQNCMKKLFLLSALALLSVCGCSQKQQTDVSSVILNKTELALVRGEVEQLTYKVVPEDADSFEVTWSVSDTEIATVDPNGIVTACKAGETDITLRCGDAEDVCHLTVSGLPAESVVVEPETLSMIKGQKVRLNATVVPEDADDKTLVWESSDESIVAVDETGTVEALGEGVAVIGVSCGDAKGQCEVSVMKDVSVGDFFYSDGSYSKELDANKTPVGIVFWVGDATLQDPVLKKECPDCNNGLAVSLTEEWGPWQFGAGICDVGSWINAWADGYESIVADTEDGGNINMVRGYNNTKAIEVFLNAPENAGKTVYPVDAVIKYRESVPLPETTSGWYVPSAKELSLLCSGEYDGNIWDLRGNEVLTGNKEFLNERIALLEGASVIDDYAAYWSSNEYSEYEAVYMFPQQGYVVNDRKDSNLYRYRYVFAF